MPSNINTFQRLIDEYRIEIPIIQRDYAMGRANNKAKDIRSNFIRQIKEVLKSENSELHLNFIYGNISSPENNENELKPFFMPLDGQQRLTTLFLLHWYLLNRTKSNADLPVNCFSYRIRTSSKNFCEEMIKNVKELIFDNNKSLTEQIIDSPWFFSYWLKDPTVKGMLTMLDEIHNQFESDKEETHLKECLSKLIKTETISFDLLDLKKLNDPDDLYIKMNARGKPLTEYENFKAWLIEYIEGEPLNVDMKDWKEKLDTKWADLFWVYKDEKNFLIDEEYMRFFRNMLQIFYLRKDGNEKIENKSGIARLLASEKGEDGEYLFVPHSFYKDLEVLTSDNISEIFQVLEILCNNKINFGLFDKKLNYFKNNSKESVEKDLFHYFVTGEMTYKDKVRFYACYRFLLKSADKKILFRWMRVFRNLITNTTIDSIKTFSRSINSLDKILDQPDKDIYKILSTKKLSIDFYDNQQIEEEREKAGFILDDPYWENLFLKYENHEYFRGKIKFLLDMSKQENNEPDQQAFEKYAQIAEEIFTKKMNDESYLDLEVALLIKEDYLIYVNSNKSFVQMNTRSKEKDQDWRTRFLNDDEKVKILKQVFDNIDPRDVITSLKNYINSEKDSITDWRKYIIQFPKIIKICDKRQIRFYSDNYIRLLKYTATRQTHSELRSYWIFCLFEDTKEYKPFNKLWYHSVTSVSDYPCAVFDEFKYKDNNKYALDVRYINGEYELRLFNRDKQFDEAFSAFLEKKGFEKSTKYNDESFLYKMKNDDEDIKNYLQDLFERLKKEL